MENNQKVLIEIFIKNDVFDPEADTILKALHTNSNKSFNNINKIKQMHSFILTINAKQEQALEIADKAAKDLLANVVIEDYRVSLYDI